MQNTTIEKELKPQPRMTMNTEHFAVQVVETDEGVILDIFHKHGDHIQSYTYWNEDTIDN